MKPNTLFITKFNLLKQKHLIMYAGFNLKTNDIKENYLLIGKQIQLENQKIIKEKLSSFISNGGTIDGSAIQEHWFPQIKADVFISYSSDDKDIALSLAGFLKDVFKLKVFIDSDVWGYADDLLWEIDINHCQLNFGFSYEKRNKSTSHVHTMLSTALAMMIEKTECLFFINPNSISVEESVNTTKSPWIYYEIGMSKLLRKNDLSLYRGETTKLFHFTLEGLDTIYKLDTSHLINIDKTDLAKWEILHNKGTKAHPLSTFYKYLNEKNNRILNG